LNRRASPNCNERDLHRIHRTCCRGAISISIVIKDPLVEPVIETAGPLLARRLIVDAFVIPFDVILQVNCEN
jgi:hypothetical protein